MAEYCIQLTTEELRLLLRLLDDLLDRSDWILQLQRDNKFNPDMRRKVVESMQRKLSNALFNNTKQDKES